MCVNILIFACQQKKRLRKVINKINPKTIIEVVHYDCRNMIINEISEELGIPTIELQHGTIHRDHSAYIYHQRTENLPWLPDYILTFSDFWSSKIKMPIEKSHIISVGFPYFEKMRNRYSAEKESGKETILFISQSTIGKQLSEFAIEVSRLLEKSRYHIIYKLHPAELDNWALNYANLLHSDIEVDFSRESIYKTFAKCDFQVGVYSTALYEGLGFHLRTFIYKIGHYDVMEDIVEAGFAEVVSNPHEFVSMLSCDWDTMQTDKFWKSNALENMKTEITRIMSNGQR